MKPAITEVVQLFTAGCQALEPAVPAPPVAAIGVPALPRRVALCSPPKNGQPQWHKSKGK
ncbi:hypothetical protein DCM91_09225 [Chitinophaga costaii]|nr:hypothetical protein DCM91_09225 [Chitinophaga costaii]